MHPDASIIDPIPPFPRYFHYLCTLIKEIEMLKTHTILIALLAVAALVPATSHPQAVQTKTLSDIRIRDPFIYADTRSATYYMYASHTETVDGQQRGGVEVWQSKDLSTWSGPKQVFTVPADNYLTGSVWAPEMHKYGKKYYLFLTLNSSIEWKHEQPGRAKYTHRCVQVMKGKSPEGPFFPIRKSPTTPIDQMALDGTLYVEQGKPYLVYCNEWVQRGDGTIRLAGLGRDLSTTIGDGHDLFCGSSAPWASAIGLSEQSGNYVTDGCFLWKTSKKLLMLWSSFCRGNYALGVAESVTGKVAGPWIQHNEPLYSEDGGHGMIFRDFQGQLHLLIHHPNGPSGSERALLIDLQETPTGDIELK